MTIATVSRGNAFGLPPALRAAQEAIHLPEVQEMLRRLSAHGLGIFMPHMHDEEDGDFQPLPHHVMQIESGLEVSFQFSAGIASQTERFLPVGWFWRAGGPTPLAACEMAQNDLPSDGELAVKYKMSPQI